MACFLKSSAVTACLLVAAVLPLAGCGSGSSGDAPDLTPVITQPIDRAHQAAGQANQAQQDLNNSIDKVAGGQ